ncbi:secreted RxLR effector protein 161-like [Salvia splendens]|uniref:secreted RxLR effector protein 161-like n=1 Tax=Salvia splendens TaxID=180675 RepID=UPI001C274184|nr:secreted RxLR effector protein 161-like [Salvia splendens]
MGGAKAVGTPMGRQFKLSSQQKPESESEDERKPESESEDERKEMQVIPYANIVGSIMYAMISTRPDLAQAISVTSRFMADHGRQHWQALKWTLTYLKGVGGFGILYKGDVVLEGDALVGHCNSDFAGNLDNRKSQSGCIFTLYGGAISWKSGLQSMVALSTTEAEYMALTAAVKESLWLRVIAAEFGVEHKAIPIGCDSNGASTLSKHQFFHERRCALSLCEEEVEKGNIVVFKVDTACNPADMLTKPLPKEKFDLCMKPIGMCERS